MLWVECKDRWNGTLSSSGSCREIDRKKRKWEGCKISWVEKITTKSQSMSEVTLPTQKPQLYHYGVVCLKEKTRKSVHQDMSQEVTRQRQGLWGTQPSLASSVQQPAEKRDTKEDEDSRRWTRKKERKMVSKWQVMDGSPPSNVQVS